MHCMQFNFTRKNSVQAGEIFGGTDRCTAGNSDCFTTAHSHIIGFLRASNTHTHTSLCQTAHAETHTERDTLAIIETKIRVSLGKSHRIYQRCNWSIACFHTLSPVSLSLSVYVCICVCNAKNDILCVFYTSFILWQCTYETFIKATYNIFFSSTVKSIIYFLVNFSEAEKVRSIVW